MRFEDYKKQIISSTDEVMSRECYIYSKLIEEEPESKYEYNLMYHAELSGIAKGAIAIIMLSDRSDLQKAKLKKDIEKLIPKYKGER